MSKETLRAKSRSAPVKFQKSFQFENEKLKNRSSSTILILKQNNTASASKKDYVINSNTVSATFNRNNVRRKWITVDRLNELRKKTLDAAKAHKTFTVRGCFYSIRNALNARGWVEKVDVYRKISKENNKPAPYEDLSVFPNRKTVDGEKQFLIKCERNLISRFLENMPVNFLWTTRKEKNDYLEQSKNGSMVRTKQHYIFFNLYV